MFKKKRNGRVKVNYYSHPKSFNKRNSVSSLKKIKPKQNNFSLLKIFLPVFIISLIYWLFFSSFFIVTEIKNVNNQLSNQALADEINGSIASAINKNLIFVDSQELAEKVIESFPELENIKITKNYPRTIQVKFSEFPISANIINQTTNIKKTYVINSIGFVIKENYENPNLPYIKIQSDEPINIEKSIIDKTKLSYILNAQTFFEDKFGMMIKEIEYKPVARELHLLTEKDFYIWLDIQQDFEEQFKKLKKSLVKLNIYEENLLYIDLRIAGNTGDKIIYKRR